MKKALYQEIELPENISANIEENVVTIKGSEGEIKKRFDIGKLKLKIEGGKIIIGNDSATKREKKMMNTIIAHIHNMIKGVQEKFEYKLKICSSHFPITVKIEGNQALIKNFLGEKVDRKVKIPEGAEVNIKKDIIEIKSIDKEIAGQAAANFEIATRITNRDRRIFQDGIYIIEKAGKEI